jgi:hypothetical protein
MAKKQILQQGGDGTAVPAGVIGEVKEGSYNSGTKTADIAATNAITLALTPGVWRISATAAFVNSSSFAATNGGYAVGITSTSAKSPLATSILPASTETNACILPLTHNNNLQLAIGCSLENIVIAANTNYYITIQTANYGSGQYVAYAYAKAVRTA